MPGLTDAGLEVPTLAEIREDINEAWRATFGSSWDLSDLSPDGQLVGIMAERFAFPWETLESLFSGLDPAKASGALLDSLCSIVGTRRLPASFSSVTLTWTGTPSAVVVAGALASTESTGQQWGVDASAGGTLAAATAWAATTAYILGDRVTNSGNIYLAVQAGTSAGSGGPTGTDPDPDVFDTDGTVRWRFLGEGTGFFDTLSKATATGPIQGLAGDVRQIDSAAGGLTGVVNILDAVPGRNEMKDPELRALRESELAQPGTSPADAIRAALLEVDKTTTDPVTAATVFMNIDDVTDADGVPPHSVEALVTGGSNQAIWDVLRLNVAAGIRTHGSVVGTSTDSSGRLQTMKFSRTTLINIYVDITLTKDPLTYPTDGDDQVEAAIVAWGNARKDGTDAVASAILAQVFTVPGVLDVDLPLIGTAPSPVSSTTIAISTRQRAAFDTSRITVTSSDGTP